jgi:hypothetical protein
MTTIDDYETERILLHLAGLVRRLEMLRLRGAGDDELAATRVAIERLHWRLAHVVRKGRAHEPRVA